MANVLNPQDVYTLFNDIVKQATGRKDLTAVNTSSFVSVGETLLRTGTENVLNAISVVVARTIFSVRPYKSTLNSLRVSPQKYGAITRKLTPLSQEFEQSQAFNTQLSPNQLADGESVDMYKINAPKVVQLNFCGTKVLQKHITRFQNQLNQAFHNEAEFMSFINMVMTNFANEIEMENESETRLTLLNYLAGLYAMGDNVVDLTLTFNTEFGTTYTREELLTSHLTEFLQHFVSEVKIRSDAMRDYSALYHSNLTNYQPILRHTPKVLQRMIMFSPFFSKAEAHVFSEIFHPLYLELRGNLETVNFWQSPSAPAAINVTPNILDKATGESKNGDNVSLPYVLGVLFDRDAIGVEPRFNTAVTTPINGAALYYNMFMHWAFNSYTDYTENGILFIMGAGGPPPQPNPSDDTTTEEDNG